MAPILTLDRLSASPAASDILGKLAFSGRDSATGTDNYAEILTTILDATSGSEDGQLLLKTAVAGAITAIASIGPGVQIGAPTGGDKGAGTLNAENGVYDKGFRTGMVWDTFMRAPEVQRGMELAGFKPVEIKAQPVALAAQ